MRKIPIRPDDKVWIDKEGKQHEFKCMNCSYCLAIYNFLLKTEHVIPSALRKRLDGCMEHVANLFDNLEE